jgi:hypothetical protein
VVLVGYGVELDGVDASGGDQARRFKGDDRLLLKIGLADRRLELVGELGDLFGMMFWYGNVLCAGMF